MSFQAATTLINVLRDLDIDGIDAEVLFPTVALTMYPISDSELLWALFRAYNTWLADCATSPDRLKGIAMLNHAPVDVAVADFSEAANWSGRRHAAPVSG